MQLNRTQLEQVERGDFDSTISIQKGDISFHKSSGNFSAEASTLHANNQEVSYMLLSTVTLINDVTRKKMSFILTRVERDADNDIMYYEYTPTRSTEANTFGIKSFKIFND